MNQVYKNIFYNLRKNKRKKIKKPILNKCPQRKAFCLKLFIMKPKKPNSARRRVARVTFMNRSKRFICYVPGNVHTLQDFSNVLVRGGRVRDLPGIRYKLVRGIYDFPGLPLRRKSRSKYGTSWWWRPPRKSKIKKMIAEHRAWVESMLFKKKEEPKLVIEKNIFPSLLNVDLLIFYKLRVDPVYMQTTISRLKINHKNKISFYTKMPVVFNSIDQK